jgi:hypothetical protein
MCCSVLGREEIKILIRESGEVLMLIEFKRKCLNHAGTIYGLDSAFVLKLSEELDYLLNEYNKGFNISDARWATAW